MTLVLAVIIVYAVHVRIIRGEIEKKVISNDAREGTGATQKNHHTR